VEDVGIFYRHLVYLKAYWYILLPFGIFSGYLVYFHHFGMLYQNKSGNPGPKQGIRRTEFSVTRLGEFSPIGRMFSLGSFFKLKK
jgi:hypothetical protein